MEICRKNNKWLLYMKYNNHLKRINSFNRANKPVACDSCEALAKQNLKQIASNSREITKVLSNFKFPEVILTSLDSLPKTKIIVMSNCDGCGRGAK